MKMDSRLVLFLIFTTLILGLDLAHADITDFLPDSCERHLQGPVTSTEGPSEADLRDSRRTAAEALLMLIFDHPMLKAAVQRTGTSDQELRTLFTASGGFALPPLKVYRSWGRDSTGFKSLVISCVFNGTYQSSQRGFCDYQSILRTPTFLKWKADLSDIADSEKGLKISSEQIRPLAYSLLRWMMYTWPKFTESKSGSLSELNTFPNLRRTEPHEYPLRLRLAVKDFSALSLAEIAAFPLTGKKASATAQQLIVDFLVLHLREILILREEILAAAKGDVGKNRSALLKTYPRRTFLRDEILKLANGQPLSLPPRQDLLASTTSTGLSLYLPEPRVLARPDRSRIEQTLQQATDDQTTDNLKIIRRVAREIDYVMSFIPEAVPIQRLLDWKNDSAHLDNWSASLLDFVGRLSDVGQQDLETIEAIEDYIGQLVAAVRAKSPLIQDPSMMDEASALQITMAQTLAVANARLERQQRWLTVLSQLQILTRQYINQRTLGETASQLQDDILGTVDSLLGFKGVVKEVAETKRLDPPRPAVFIGGPVIEGPHTRDAKNAPADDGFPPLIHGR